MATDHVTVCRRVESDGIVIIETATATLADDLSLDELTEARRRGLLARCLFHALPSVEAINEARYQAKQSRN